MPQTRTSCERARLARYYHALAFGNVCFARPTTGMGPNDDYQTMIADNGQQEALHSRELYSRFDPLPDTRHTRLAAKHARFSSAKVEDAQMWVVGCTRTQRNSLWSEQSHDFSRSLFLSASRALRVRCIAKRPS